MNPAEGQLRSTPTVDTRMAKEPTTTRAMPTKKILRPRGRPNVDGDRESGCWFMGDVSSRPDLPSSDKLTPKEMITQHSSQSYFHEQLGSTTNALSIISTGGTGRLAAKAKKNPCNCAYRASMFTLFIFTKQVPRLQPGTVQTRAQGGLCCCLGSSRRDIGCEANRLQCPTPVPCQHEKSNL